jgi:L-lactate utilization protein LutC
MNYSDAVSQESVEKTVTALQEHHFEPIVVATKEDALQKIKELIPAGVSVMNGTSRTLEQIGFIDYLKAHNHGWNNLHAAIIAEQDQAKQANLRRQSVISDYYLGSVHSLTETGELVIASNTGSQLPHIVYTSPNLIFVVGAQKITKDLTDAMKRLNEKVIPLEDERMKQVYGFGTTHAKTVILHKENPAMGRTIRVIIVNEVLGF